jgi:hypothetical protein
MYSWGFVEFVSGFDPPRLHHTIAHPFSCGWAFCWPFAGNRLPFFLAKMPKTATVCQISGLKVGYFLPLLPIQFQSTYRKSQPWISLQGWL